MSHVAPAARTPDFRQLLKVLRREAPDRPTLFEFFLNLRLYRRFAGTAWVEAPASRLDDYRRMVAAFRAAGYDFATVHGPMTFPCGEHHRAQTISLNEGFVITDRKSFNAYAWPNPDACDWSALAAIEPELGGMRLMIAGPGGVLENVISLVGYDNLCLMLADDPGLASDIFEAVGSRLVRYYARALEFGSVGVVMSNDDWGFKTQTMLSPTDMRRHVFPWHRRIVEVAHAAARPAILHSCGNAGEIMEDIAGVMRYDAKHSFEDAICPVETVYKEWGRRIALLGGIDLDFIVRSSPEAIAERSRAILALASAGGYALGTGNSVPEYIADEKYLAMTRVALEA